MTAPSAQSLRGLDWLNFFVANVQTGFGPFVAVYLTTKAWTQAEIGEVLSLATVVAMLSQIPGGAVVDRLRDKRLAAAVSGVAVAASAVLFAASPTKPAVVLAEVLHAFASCMLGPALAAISLALVGRHALGERLGRNARYASLGNGAAAAVLGLCGAYVSNRAVFWLTAALMVPGMVALAAIRREDLAGAAPARPPLPASDDRGNGIRRPEKGSPDRGRGAALLLLLRDVLSLLRSRRVLLFAACVGLFHVANAAILPLAAGEVTRNGAGSTANLLVAACIVLPQLLVAVVSPLVGRAADRVGHRPVLLAGFAALPARACLLAVVDSPVLLVAVQVLDGISAAVFGVMLPLVAADLTRGPAAAGRFNLCLGVLGLAASLGATLSTLLAGGIADEWGVRTAFLALAVCGGAAVLAVFAAVPRPPMAAHADRRPVEAP